MYDKFYIPLLLSTTFICWVLPLTAFAGVLNAMVPAVGVSPADRLACTGKTRLPAALSQGFFRAFVVVISQEKIHVYLAQRMNAAHTIPPAPALQAPDGRTPPVYLVSFFDGMLAHHRAALEYAVRLTGGRNDRVECIICSRSATTAASASDVFHLLGPDERETMLHTLGFPNTLFWQIPHEHSQAATPAWPGNGGRMKMPPGILLPAADLWEHPISRELPAIARTAAGGFPVGVDDVFRTAGTTEHATMTGTIREGCPEPFLKTLGYAYPLSGSVAEGNKIGRTLGYPTANLRIADPLKTIPGQGVYAALVRVGKKWYGSMVNIGIRPTLDMEQVTIEAHLFGFANELYGKEITIAFLARIRDEMKFSSLDELRGQLGNDKRQTEQVLGSLLPEIETNAFVTVNPAQAASKWS